MNNYYLSISRRSTSGAPTAISEAKIMNGKITTLYAIFKKTTFFNYFTTRSKHKKRASAKQKLNQLGYPDSNQERQDQNLQCYHYTIAQFLNAMQRYSFFL